MTRADLVARLERHRDAFKRRDADALAADHAPEGIFESPAHGIVKGRAAIRDVYVYWFTTAPRSSGRLRGPRTVRSSASSVLARASK
jgi:ketosteroid isomerase-like protein